MEELDGHRGSTACAWAASVRRMRITVSAIPRNGGLRQFVQDTLRIPGTRAA